MNTSTTSLTPPIEQAIVLRSFDEDGSASGWSLLLAAGIVLAISTRAPDAAPQSGASPAARSGSSSGQAATPLSSLGAALRARRNDIVKAGVPVLSWNEIEQELGERSGESEVD